jgi:hypothetical protein
MKKIIRILLLVLFIPVLVLTVSYLLSGGDHEIVNKVRINKSPAEVFNFISDMRNELKWNPDVQFMEKITEGEIGAGTKFRAKWHLSDTLVLTIEKFDRPAQITFVNGGPIEVTLNATLAPIESGTELESHFIAKPTGFARAIFPIIKMQLEKQERLNMVNLKYALEK